MALLAGITSSFEVKKENIYFKLKSYNHGFDKYLAEFFKNIREVDVDDSFLNELFERKLRALKNSKTKEPYQRLAALEDQALRGFSGVDEKIKITKELTKE